MHITTQTVENHEGVELGALAIATVLNEVEVADVEASHNAVRIVICCRFSLILFESCSHNGIIILSHEYAHT